MQENSGEFRGAVESAAERRETGTENDAFEFRSQGSRTHDELAQKGHVRTSLEHSTPGTHDEEQGCKCIGHESGT
eukprot:11802647-Alexandrium_andersonii.AAC.1